MATRRGKKGDELRKSLVSSLHPPGSGGMTAADRHAEEADDPDEEEDDELFFFFLPPRLFLPPRFLFFQPVLEFELSESDVTGAATPFPRRGSSWANLQVASLGQNPLLHQEKQGRFSTAGDGARGLFG